MTDSSQLSHLEALRSDIRDEIKKRIEQRDKYSVQMTIALGAIVGVAFSKTELQKVLIAAPLISIYFTALILYSYRVRDVLAAYLRDRLEPALSSLCGTRFDLEWEQFYLTQAPPGIRKRFFGVTPWVISVVTLMYLSPLALTVSSIRTLPPFLRVCIPDSKFCVALFVSGVLYLGGCWWLRALTKAPPVANARGPALAKNTS